MEHVVSFGTAEGASIGKQFALLSQLCIPMYVRRRAQRSVRDMESNFSMSPDSIWMKKLARPLVAWMFEFVTDIQNIVPKVGRELTFEFSFSVSTYFGTRTMNVCLALPYRCGISSSEISTNRLCIKIGSSLLTKKAISVRDVCTYPAYGRSLQIREMSLHVRMHTTESAMSCESTFVYKHFASNNIRCISAAAYSQSEQANKRHNVLFFYEKVHTLSADFFCIV